MTNILLTGFLPENDRVDNASWRLIRYLERALPAGWAVALLPQETAVLPELVPRLLEEHQPRLTVLCGQAPGRTKLGLEAVALNVRAFRMPDAAGEQPADDPIDPAGPPALRTRLPLESAASALREAGIPAAVSWHAGTFLCNQAYYHALRWWQAENGRGDGLFLHLPLLPSQTIHEPGMAERASWPVEYVAEAVRKLASLLP